MIVGQKSIQEGGRMEYTYRKWGHLKRKFSLAITIPIITLAVFSCFYLFGQYTNFLTHVNYKKDMAKMVVLNSLRLEIERETQSMRSFYLGVQNFDHLRLQKEFTQGAIKKFRDQFSAYPKTIQRLEANVIGPMSIARDQVLSGQSRWPETQKKMVEISKWLSNFTPDYVDARKVLPFQFQLDKLQEGVISTRALKNNLSFVIVRDMPLNSIQFSTLISSYERSQYLHKQVANFLLNGTDRMKFLYNQQIIMWGKITADYQKTLETIEQGRYGIRLSDLIKRFERLEKSQMAPVQLKRDSILAFAQNELEKSRSGFLLSFLCVMAIFFVSTRLTISAYRKGLFYLATSFSGHEIKVISAGMKEGKLTPMYPLHPVEPEYLEHINKNIA